MNKDYQADFVGAGFERLDDDAVAKHPPKIKWGQLYRDKTVEERLAYAEKLASTMNHSARIIQDQRDELNKLLETKEKLINQVNARLVQNNIMIQRQITQHNEEKQMLQEAIAKKNAEIKELKG